MSSLRSILAPRANGDLSKGPKTELGKQRSALNALRHGLFSQSIVLENENPEGFALCWPTTSPADGVECCPEVRYRQMYQRSPHNFMLLRLAGLPNEPSPTSEH